MSCLVHGDSSGAGGSSCSGHGGHSQPPAPLSLKWRRSLRDPVRAPDSWSCQGASASELALEGFLFLWAVLSCLSGPGGFSCLVLYCPVCLAPEGSWYPLTSPGIFFLFFLGGGVVRVPAVGAGPRGPRPRPRSPSAMASRAPSSAMVSVVCSALEVPVLCSCPCLSWGASRAPTPPPRWNCYGVGHAFREGGVMSGFCCVSSVPASCVHIWFVSCPCFMSLWVNLCPAVCMWLCVNYPVYLVPVFWVWFRLVYSLLPVFPVCLVLPCLH